MKKMLNSKGKAVYTQMPTFLLQDDYQEGTPTPSPLLPPGGIINIFKTLQINSPSEKITMSQK
jgi:hypothetical protein